MTSFLNTGIVTSVYNLHIFGSYEPSLKDYVFCDRHIRCKLCFFPLFQAEKVHELNEEIGKLLAKAEQLGAEGNVDEAQKVLQEVGKVRTKKKDAEVSKGCFGGASSLMW